MNRPHRTLRRLLRASTLAVATLLLVGIGLPASAAGYLRISGEGSSWAGNAVAQWVSDAGAQGVTVDYTPNGSSTGRSDFAKEINADFAVTETVSYTHLTLPTSCSACRSRWSAEQ